MNLRNIALMLAAALLAACDQTRVAKLEEGVSTEADVRRQFGEPAQIIEKADGSKVLAYPRQPEGRTNYEIGIGADGKMSSLRQLLTVANFAKVRPGMEQSEVRTLLGRHARTVRYPLKPDEEIWRWHALDGQSRKVFEVTFDRTGKVLASTVSDDELEAQTGR